MGTGLASSSDRDYDTDQAETERALRYAPEELVDGLLDAVTLGLDQLLDSPRGKRHEHLAVEPEEALLALLGEPIDARDDWTALAVDLRSVMMQQTGLSLGAC